VWLPRIKKKIKALVIHFTVLLSVCWHNSHKASYRDVTRTQGKYTNNKQQMKRHKKKDNKGITS